MVETKNNDSNHFKRTGGHLCDDIELLKMELDNEIKNRNLAQLMYSDMNLQTDSFVQTLEEAKIKPQSKYDTFILKQNCINETLEDQITDAKAKLDGLTRSFRNIEICGKECGLNMRDLIIDYNCITKSELTKEVKRFERLQIDLKSNIDRLQWRLDCESKIYYNLLDQFQKLQIELYYLKNLGDKYSFRGLWMQ